MSIVIRLCLVLFLIQVSGKLGAQAPATWTVDAAAFQYQMSVTCKATEACVGLADTNNYIAAFVGTQCRGAVKTKVAFGSGKLALLTIKSNVVSGEKVSFKVYKASGNTVLTMLDSVLFNQGTQTGTLANPFVLYTNHPPSSLLISTHTITEHAALATPVASLSATDSDAGATFNYSLTTGQPENTQFAITGNQLLVNADFDYETDSVKLVEIRVADNGGCSYAETFTVTIINSTDPFEIIVDTTVIAEDNEPLFHVSKIRTVGTNHPNAFTFELALGSGDEDNSAFEIQNDNLVIRYKTNYDVKELYHIRIRSTDLGGSVEEKAFEITVTDIAGNTVPLPSTNYISPNGDSKNDFWKIENVDSYNAFALQIFDQFGHIIFEVPNNYHNEFDGKLNGNALPTGNYYYVFKNEKLTYKGNITIVN
jgi:gliding motility-associated-like protein